METEQEFIKLEVKAEAMFKSHSYYAKVYLIINEFITISVILVSGIITAFLPMIPDNTTVLNSVLAFYITLVTSVVKSYKPAERYERHRIASQHYISLKAFIRGKIIAKEIEDIAHYQEIIKKFEDLRQESPFVSNKTYDRHKKHLSNTLAL